MPSTPNKQPESTPDSVVAIAQRLCGAQVIAAQFCGGGGNNRVYRIQTRRAFFAIKFYGSSDLDDRDRLGHEFDGLCFLKASGIGSSLPTPLAVDRTARCALYEWIEGVAPLTHGAEDITAALDLLGALHQARNADGAASLPAATEAVLRLADLLDQIGRRLARLASVGKSEVELAAFLETEVQPELDRRIAGLSKWDLNTMLPPAQRTLSPSDFGFHNAMRRADGSICFIDFEYFGWDDPVKLTADFLWHPAVELSIAERLQFINGVTHLYADDAQFLQRLAVCFPLYGIRWVLIILNEFLPQLWARRGFSGKGGDWVAAKRAQLHKARTKLQALHSYNEGHFT